MAAFLMAQPVFVFVQNSSQSSPLSRMKFVISRKAWHVIGRSSGMEWGGMVYLEYLWSLILFVGLMFKYLVKSMDKK